MEYINNIDFSKLSEEYQGAKYFPHIIIDNFFKEEKLEHIFDQVELLKLEDSTDKFSNSKFENNKFGFCYKELNAGCKHILGELNSDGFIKHIETLTGIKNIIHNYDLRGAGVHKSIQGGLLGAHTDFNMYYDSVNGIIDRRINILIYLNKDWKEEYGGELILYDQELKPFNTILPIFNRCVIFSTTNKSIHGHPHALTCPENIVRQSIANYYYTRNAESSDQKNIKKVKDFEGDTIHSTLFFDIVNNDKTPYEWDGKQFNRNKKYEIHR
jgi:hypothetical protein